MDAWNLLVDEAARWGLRLSSEQVDRLRRFYALLVEANKTTNLTRIVDEQEAVIKHFLDSLSVFAGLEPGSCDRPSRFIDVGAGAGFPGIPLLIACPSWKGTMLEATRKKVDFINEAIRELGLEGEAIHGRAEELAREAAHREAYNLVFARAVAELGTLAELCLPFNTLGGHFVAMKGSRAEEEIGPATKAIALLGGAPPRVASLRLPDNHGERRILVIDKLKATPNAYPRRPGVPSAKPLC